MNLKSVLAEFLPLHRTLASDGMDETLRIIGSYMPEQAGYAVENFAPLTRAWTWKIPERYVVHEAYLESEDGERIVDFKDNPLHLISYSLPIDRVLNWDELAPHLRFSERRPNAIPWEFKYYERDWGFCLPKIRYDQLSRDKKYHARIDAEFITDPQNGLRVGVGLLRSPQTEGISFGEFIVQSHTCHPAQANDDGSGVVCEIELARRLAQDPLPNCSMNVRFWFGPETIGTVAYLAHHEELIPNLRGGMFLDCTGNQNSIALQRTLQDDHLLDRIARSVLQQHGGEFREGAFAQVAPNDERILNGAGVNVPSISLSRFPYPEYHTSDDNLDILDEDRMKEVVDIAEQIVRIYASNYIPRRTFRGPVFLSGYGLWVDWRENWALNRAVEKIMMMFESRHSIFEIAERVGLDYWEVRAYVERFRACGLVTAHPIPRGGYE